MATITNVTLSLQRSGSQSPLSSRTATVRFTTRFSLLEIQEAALFTAVVRLQAVDDATIGDPTHNMGLESVRATSESVETTLTNVFTRSALDEDRDVVVWLDRFGRPHSFSEEREDAWRARVVLTPVIQAIRRNSAIVRGSWGIEGNN